MDKRILATAVVLLVLSLLSLGEGARILGLVPLGQSHNIMGVAYMKTLAAAGHDVTVLTPTAQKNPPKNYREILLTGMLESQAKNEQNLFKFKGSGPVSAGIMMMFLYKLFPEEICKFVLEHPNVIKLLESGEKFDLVLAESFVAESLYGFAQHFNAPLITYSAFGNCMWTNDLVGTPAPSSHVAHFSLTLTDRMTYWERMFNSAWTLLDRAYYSLFYLPEQKKLYEATFPNPQLSFDQQMKNVSLVFLNQHFSISSPRPMATNMIEVGGVHIDDPKPLPKDLQTYIDEAKDGVIYFCMGSNLKSKDMPVEKRDAFLKAFSKLKQRVLWKFEDDTIPNQPPNLKIQSWMPQNDILAHPNVKVFITHGGLLGSTESIFHGKPMIGIPIFGDQMMNVQKAVQAGYSVFLDYDDISEQTVSAAINEVLNNPAYTQKVQQISQRFRDKPMTPRQTVTYWVDYVLRHHGAPHLKSPAVDLSFWQYHSLDVLATFLAIFIVILVLEVMIVKAILRKIFRKKSKADSKKKRS
ncbi:UDP-glycosyltransferase UGT5-like [Uranotaenia lowii]|uniref:UDP-glycosyltransferase UGT5-like n=1 Tax=Uranotaenia lowii TaxID=190385 RepID=UPI00247998C0|nr:UDP-glycosyltransferase UGT5-like [Uranotaenia lowii]